MVLNCWVGTWHERNEDDEHGFSYLPEAANGPSQWGAVRSEWAACSVGRMQSPIVLSAAAPGLDDGRAGRMGHAYRRAAASVVNRGHDITVRSEADPTCAADFWACMV